MDPAEFEQVLRELIADRPTAFSYRGAEYTAIRSRMDSEFLQGDYGYVSGYRFTLRAVLSDFGDETPKAGDLVNVGAETFRILDPVEIDSLGVGVLLHLGGRAN